MFQVLWAVLQPGSADDVALHPALHDLLFPPLRAALDSAAGSDKVGVQGSWSHKWLMIIFNFQGYSGSASPGPARWRPGWWRGRRSGGCRRRGPGCGGPGDGAAGGEAEDARLHARRIQVQVRDRVPLRPPGPATTGGQKLWRKEDE